MESKKEVGMTREQLAGFTARANKYFKGETDRELWALALPKVAAERADVAMAALEQYAIQWGGPRARFIPSKFFEFLQDVKVRRLELTQREAREREARMRAIASDRDAMICEADWLALRREIEVANPLRVGEAIDLLRSIGWGSPPAAFSDWSRMWIIAVADIVAGRKLPTRDPETGEFTWLVPADQFYRIAGKPLPSLTGAF
jgi:hypothetical protein